VCALLWTVSCTKRCARPMRTYLVLAISSQGSPSTLRESRFEAGAWDTVTTRSIAYIFLGVVSHLYDVNCRSDCM